MTRTGAFLGACFWVLGACACAVPHVGEQGPKAPNESAEKVYQATLNRYSDHAEVYDLLDTRIFAGMTYQSWPFREARVQRVALFQEQPRELVEKNLATERASFDSFHEFFFGVYSASYRYDDFDRKDSIWRIALVTGSGETTPVSVERIGRSTLNMRAIYPYLDDFWVAYRIRFAKTSSSGAPVIPPGTTSFIVRVASTVGRADLHFPAE
jgi:hypothetical protein